MSQAYYNRFHEQIQVNSAVRTVKVQKKLRRHNRNAAPAEGDTASSHLAGVTLDIQRRGMTREQVHFVHRYLFYLRALGLIEPEEERRQWVFHVDGLRPLRRMAQQPNCDSFGTGPSKLKQLKLERSSLLAYPDGRIPYR